MLGSCNQDSTVSEGVILAVGAGSSLEGRKNETDEVGKGVPPFIPKAALLDLLLKGRNKEY
jgi:hypothetical protein